MIKKIVVLFLLSGFTLLSSRLHADEATQKSPTVVYPKETKLDFSGIQIQGELRNPGEFYFQHRPTERFDSLVKPKRNFHREMLRDAVLTR